MKEIVSDGINIHKHALKSFLKNKRARQRADQEVLLYGKRDFTSSMVTNNRNGNNGGGVSETLINKFKPFHEVGEVLLSRGTRELVFNDGFVYNIEVEVAGMDATWSDIKARKIEERRRAMEQVRSGSATPEMSRYARKRTPVETVLFSR